MSVLGITYSFTDINECRYKHINYSNLVLLKNKSEANLSSILLYQILIILIGNFFIKYYWFILFSNI